MRAADDRCLCGFYRLFALLGREDQILGLVIAVKQT
jgi:hypothetical protein